MQVSPAKITVAKTLPQVMRVTPRGTEQLPEHHSSKSVARELDKLEKQTKIKPRSFPTARTQMSHTGCHLHTSSPPMNTANLKE